nr:uncharacterized mitochondrial protein AtMg00810-like [Tanacetum cinerariifolium]
MVKCFEISMMGEMKFFLGLQVNQFSNRIFRNQSKYILDILKRFGMENCDTVPTLMVEQAKLKLDLVGKPVDHTNYRSMIGSLMYVTSSRPDIMFATEIVAAELAKSVSIKEPRTQQRQRSQLTIDGQINEDVADTYAEWGQKIKGLAVDDPVVQSLLDLRKGSKASRLKSLKQMKQPVTGEGSSAAYTKYYANSKTDSDAILHSSCSDTSEESTNETDDVDELDMDLTADNPVEDDDVVGLEGKPNLEGLPRPHQLILDKLELVDQLLRAYYKPFLCKSNCSSSRLKISYKIVKIQVAQKKFKKAFENVDSSLRIELIPSKIKYAIKVILSFHEEFLVFSSLSRKEND